MILVDTNLLTRMTRSHDPQSGVRWAFLGNVRKTASTSPNFSRAPGTSPLDSRIAASARDRNHLCAVLIGMSVSHCCARSGRFRLLA
jgi:hypothetical protein